MGFWVFLLTLAVFYCFYKIAQLEKNGKKEEMKQEDLNKAQQVIYERLSNLQGCLCEIQFKQMMYYMGSNWSSLYSLRGVIDEVDQEWVFLHSENEKKAVQHLLLLENIKDVIEIRTA